MVGILRAGSRGASASWGTVQALAESMGRYWCRPGVVIALKLDVVEVLGLQMGQTA
jgi:hypothetical protein